MYVKYIRVGQSRLIQNRNKSFFKTDLVYVCMYLTIKVFLIIDLLSSFQHFQNLLTNVHINYSILKNRIEILGSRTSTFYTRCSHWEFFGKKNFSYITSIFRNKNSYICESNIIHPNSGSLGRLKLYYLWQHVFFLFKKINSYLLYIYIYST